MNKLLIIVFCITLFHLTSGFSFTIPSAWTDIFLLSILLEAAPQFYNWGDTYA